MRRVGSRGIDIYCSSYVTVNNARIKGASEYGIKIYWGRYNIIYNTSITNSHNEVAFTEYSRRNIFALSTIRDFDYVAAVFRIENNSENNGFV